MALSFRSDLWDSFPMIKEEFEGKYHQLKTLMEVLYYLSQVELNFSKEMKRVFYLAKGITRNSHLSTLFNAFFTSLEDIAISYKAHSKKITKALISPMNDFIVNQLDSTQHLFDEALLSEQKCFKKEKKLDAYQKEYRSECVNLTHTAISFEVIIAKPNLVAEEMNRAKVETLRLNAKVKEAKEKYVGYIKRITAFKERHIESMKLLLDDAQSRYVSLLEFFKWLFNEANQSFKDLANKLISYNEAREAIYNAFSVNDCLNEFISGHISTHYPDCHYDFFPEKIESRLFDSIPLPKKTIEEVKSKLQTAFKYYELEPDLQLYSSQMLHLFIKDAWEGSINTEMKPTIISLLRDNKGSRSGLFSFLNVYRTQGVFLISNTTYTLLIELFNVILDCCEEDYAAIQTVIIASQTFYCEDKGRRRVLQEGLAAHPVFHKEIVWKEMMKRAISEQIHKKKRKQLMANDEVKQLRSLVKVIMMTHLFNMQSFKVSSLIIKEIAGYFSRSFKIKDDLISISNAIVIESEQFRIDSSTEKINHLNNTHKENEENHSHE